MLIYSSKNTIIDEIYLLKAEDLLNLYLLMNLVIEGKKGFNTRDKSSCCELDNDSHFPSVTLQIFLQVTPQTHKLSQRPQTLIISNIHEQTICHPQSCSARRRRRPAAEYPSSSISGVWLFQMDPLCHLPGAVQRHARPHCGHRHGDGIDETVLRLHPDLT